MSMLWIVINSFRIKKYFKPFYVELWWEWIGGTLHCGRFMHLSNTLSNHSRFIRNGSPCMPLINDLIQSTQIEIKQSFELRPCGHMSLCINSLDVKTTMCNYLHQSSALITGYNWNLIHAIRYSNASPPIKCIPNYMFSNGSIKIEPRMQ